MSDQVPRGGALNFWESEAGAGQQEREEAATRGAKGLLNDQVPKGAPLNFQEEGEMQKAKQPSYSAVAQGAAVPRAKTGETAPDKPVGATAAARPGGYMLCCTNQTEAECLSRMLLGAPEGQWQQMKKHVVVGSAVFL